MDKSSSDKYRKLYDIIDKHKEALKSIVKDSLLFIDFRYLGIGVFFNEIKQETQYYLFDLEDEVQRAELSKRSPAFETLESQGYFEDFMPCVVQFYNDPKAGREGGLFTNTVLLDKQTYLVNTDHVQDTLVRSL